MKKTKEKNTAKNFLNKLGISKREFTSPADYTADLKRIIFFSDAGIFLIMLIQILQEFVPVIYLNYLLVFIGIVEIVLFLFGRLLYVKLYRKEPGKELITWDNTITFHNNFVLSIFVPMVFFFDSDIISFAGTRVSNVMLLKELLVLFAFLSLFLYKYIRRRLEQLSPEPAAADSAFKKTKLFCHIAFYYDIFLVYSIFTLIIGMMNKDERLGGFVFVAAFTLGYTFVIPLFINDRKKILQKLFLALFAAFSIFMLYEQYLMKMDISYDFQPSVYSTTQELTNDNRLEIYCSFTDKESTEQLTYYFVFRKETGDILYYAVAEYEFLPYKWREGIFAWYDSSFATKLPKKNVLTDGLPVELQFLSETVSYSPDFPEAYQKYVLGTEYVYSGFEEHSTDLFLLMANGHGWFRGFTLKPTASLPEDIAKLR